MIHYAKEPGEEQELETDDLRFSQKSVVSVMTVETLVVFLVGGTHSAEEKGPHSHTAPTFPRLNPGMQLSNNCLPSHLHHCSHHNYMVYTLPRPQL